MLLFCVNLLNYIDRQVLYAVFPLIKADLKLSDSSLGLLGSAFMICYMISAPLFGWLGNSINRIRLASGGLIIWSIATAASGFMPDYRMLMAARTTVGIGEASFGTVSPGLVSDFFSKALRGRVLSLFFLAIPVGSALGYILGGVIGHHFGWHAAFLIVGIPGLLLAIPLSFLKDQAYTVKGNYACDQLKSPWASYLSLVNNRSFVSTTLSMATMTFALGGLAQWVPTFLYRMHHLNVAKGNMIFGAVTIVAGIGGTLSGGWLGDRLHALDGKGYPKVSGLGFLLGAPIAAYALMTPSLPFCIASIFISEFFLFMNTGPLNTVIVNVTRPQVRAMAFALNIFFIHALGDAVSPALIGTFSDIWGLRNALLLAPVALLLAAFFAFLCMRSITKDSSEQTG